MASASARKKKKEKNPFRELLQLSQWLSAEARLVLRRHKPQLPRQEEGESSDAGHAKREKANDGLHYARLQQGPNDRQHKGREGHEENGSS